MSHFFFIYHLPAAQSMRNLNQRCSGCMYLSYFCNNSHVLSFTFRKMRGEGRQEGMDQIKVSRYRACISHSAVSCPDWLVSDDQVVLEAVGDESFPGFVSVHMWSNLQKWLYFLQYSVFQFMYDLPFSSPPKVLIVMFLPWDVVHRICEGSVSFVFIEIVCWHYWWPFQRLLIYRSSWSILLNLCQSLLVMLM